MQSDGYHGVIKISTEHSGSGQLRSLAHCLPWAWLQDKKHRVIWQHLITNYFTDKTQAQQNALLAELQTLAMQYPNWISHEVIANRIGENDYKRLQADLCFYHHKSTLVDPNVATAALRQALTKDNLPQSLWQNWPEQGVYGNQALTILASQWQFNWVENAVSAQPNWFLITVRRQEKGHMYCHNSSWQYDAKNKLYAWQKQLSWPC